MTMPTVLLALSLLVGCRDEPAPDPVSTCDDCEAMRSWDFPAAVDAFHHGFDVDNGRLVLRSRSYVHVFDAEATPPVWQGAVHVGFGWDVAVDGDVAYATTDFGVAVLDLSDPTAPRKVGEAFWVQDGRSFEANVVAHGSTAWVLEPFSGGLWAVDASDPTAPEVAAELEVEAFAMERVDDVLWLAGGSRVLAWDVAETLPVEVAVFEAPGTVDRFGIDGDVLLASYWVPGGDPAENGFVRWDVDDADSGRVQAVEKGSCGQGTLVPDGDRAYLPCPDLHEVDLATGAFGPSSLLDGVEAPSSLELVRDGDRVHGMPVANGLVERAPWVSWGLDGSEAVGADLRPDAVGGSQVGTVLVDQRLFVRWSGKTLAIDVDRDEGPQSALRWEVDVMHGHDGVLVTDRGLLDADGTDLGVELPEIDGDWVGAGSTVVGMRELTLVVVDVDRTSASVVAEWELELEDDCGGSVFCQGTVRDVGDGVAALSVLVSGFVDGAYGSSERTLVVDLASGEQVGLDLSGEAVLGPAHLYGVDGNALVVVELASGEEVGRLEGYAAGAMTVADGVLVGRLREGIQVFDLSDPARPEPTCLYPDTLAGILRGQVLDGVWFGPHYAGVDWVGLGRG